MLPHTPCIEQKAQAPLTLALHPWAETHTVNLSMDRKGQTHRIATFQEEPKADSYMPAMEFCGIAYL